MTTKTVDFAKGILMIVAALLFVISFTSLAAAEGSWMSTISGQVMAVDSQARTVTVRSNEPGSFGMGQFTFATDKMTSVTSCAQNKTFNDIVVGQDVTVRYHEKDGKLLADAIEKKIPLSLACIYP